MQGFILVQLSEESGNISGYWTGSIFDQDISKAQFIASKSEARSMAGRLQTAQPEADCKALPAELTIALQTEPTPQAA